MKKGFSLLEIIITTFLIIILGIILHNWQRSFWHTAAQVEQYYLETKPELLEQVVYDQGEPKMLTGNVYLKIVSTNGYVLEYLATKK